MFELTSTQDPRAAGPTLRRDTASKFGTYHALIIGNKTYSHWPSLATPAQDAPATAALRKAQYGFQTTVLLNATRFAILQAPNDLRTQLTDQDNLLLYDAGHGHWDPQIQCGDWMPVDGHTDSDVHWIPTLAFLDMLMSNTDILAGQRLGRAVAARGTYAAATLVEQEPQYAPIRYAGHEAGDFLFVPTAP